MGFFFLPLQPEQQHVRKPRHQHRILYVLSNDSFHEKAVIPDDHSRSTIMDIAKKRRNTRNMMERQKL